MALGAEKLLASSIAPGESGGVPGGIFGTTDDFRPKFGPADFMMVSGMAGQAISGFNSARDQQRVAENNATFSRLRARFEAARFSRDATRNRASIEARLSASGTTLSGSALDVLAHQAALDEENRQLILFQGEAAARESQMRADRLEREGRSDLLSGLTQTATTLLPFVIKP